MTNTDPNRDVHGTSKVTPVARKKGLGWLAWLIAALVLLALLFLLLRSCGHKDQATTTNTTETTTVTNTPSSAATPPVAVEQVTLPNGKTVGLEPKTLNYDLQRYLASSAPTPQTFTFGNLNFATDSASLPSGAQATVGALAQILTAYPKARVQLNGYADSTGTDPHNTQLGAARAQSVAQALQAQGVAADRIKTATGGASNPVDTNATSQGRAENRRTELTVLAK
ncbi:OmpA family protein [Caulobacter sp. S45]|uniref:OmpA family protein n=1 Tax=Caulobacter sp. S45 TaxID=1641861 RepID=UPI001575997C|nr:OmpA family protein [Caulobacter sp. S45]